MKLTEKLDSLLHSLPKNQLNYIPKEKMDEIFGGDFFKHAYTTDFFPTRYVFFEEDGVLYYLVNTNDNLEGEHYFIVTDNKFYQKVDEKLFFELLKEEEKLETRLSIIKKVTHHPSFRLKKLFKNSNEQ